MQCRKELKQNKKSTNRQMTIPTCSIKHSEGEKGEEIELAANGIHLMPPEHFFVSVGPPQFKLSFSFSHRASCQKHPAMQLAPLLASGRLCFALRKLLTRRRCLQEGCGMYAPKMIFTSTNNLVNESWCPHNQRTFVVLGCWQAVWFSELLPWQQNRLFLYGQGWDHDFTQVVSS